MWLTDIDHLNYHSILMTVSPLAMTSLHSSKSKIDENIWSFREHHVSDTIPPHKKGEGGKRRTKVFLSSIFLISPCFSVQWLVESKRVHQLVVDDLMQSPWAPLQEAWLGRQPGTVGRGCVYGWPGTRVGYWRTWCGGSWCLWPRSQSASSPQNPCP